MAWEFATALGILKAAKAAKDSGERASNPMGTVPHDDPPVATSTSTSEPAIVVIEDDPQFRRLLRTIVENHGYRYFEAASGQEGLTQAATRQPDVIIVDLSLPDLDGLDVIRRIREWTSTPILVVSSREEERDKVAALDAGADDYMTKPFGASELLARIRTAFRHGAGGRAERISICARGAWKIDFERRQVFVDGGEVRLTPMEYKLLTILVRHAGKVVTSGQLIKEIWGPANVDQVGTLRVIMLRLRRKLEADPARPRYLRSEPGVGYRLVDG